MPLKFVVKNHKVHAKGTCESFPCAVGSWRCAECTALLVKTYAGVVSGLHDKALQDDAEKEMRNRQAEEMRAVIDQANAQMPVLLDKAIAAQDEAKKAKIEAETWRLKMQDISAQLELAKRDVVADQLKDVKEELARTRTELADVRFRLGHEQLVAHEAKRQQCLGAADAKNFRRYIKSARDKEANFKADAARLQKKLTAMGLEMVNKDGATAEMQARIDELSRMSGEAIKHQDDMKQQNDSLSNMVMELTNALEAACETEHQLRLQCQALQKQNSEKNDQIAQIQGIMSVQRNEAQSTKNLLAREKAMRKQAERQAHIVTSNNPSNGKQAGAGQLSPVVQSPPRGEEEAATVVASEE